MWLKVQAGSGGVVMAAGIWRGGGGPLGGANLPACQFSHIFETGEHEIVSLPDKSPLADQWGCAARVEEKEVADVERLDKGHTEGLEPHVTEAIVKLIVAAPGGKVANAAKL